MSCATRNLAAVNEHIKWIICAAAPDANLVSGLVCNLISKCNAEFSNVVILDVDDYSGSRSTAAEDAISALAH
jgi:hypothetical protein